jgi:hypothetical protein
MNRKEKEKLYIEKMTELQLRWKNPISDEDFEDMGLWTDEQIDKGLADTIGQLKFEKVQSAIGKSILFMIIAVVGIGVLGLLLFGIRQIFPQFLK